MIKNNIKRKLKTAPVRIEIDLHEKAMAHAKKNGINFSKLVRMLLTEELQGLKKTHERIEEENEIIKELKFKNEMLEKIIIGLKNEIFLKLDLNQKALLQKMENLSVTPPYSVKIKERVLNVLTPSMNGKGSLLSLQSISRRLNIPEVQLIEVIRELQEENKIFISNDFKIGRIIQ